MTDIPADTSTNVYFDGEGNFEGALIFGSYSGRLEQYGDHDWIAVRFLYSGARYDIFAHVEDDLSPGYGDSVVTLRDEAGNVVATNDDNPNVLTNNSYISFISPAAGRYYIDIAESGGQSTGNYSVFIREVDFVEEPPVFLAHASNSYVVRTGSGGTIVGNAGNDVIVTGNSSVTLLGEQGHDRLDVSKAAQYSCTLSGGAGNDTLIGGNDRDGDFLYGDSGNDNINGLGGRDHICGGLGRDFLRGGLGRDAFCFTTARDSGGYANTRDKIADFVVNQDDIHLDRIDAKPNVAGDQSFNFIGKRDFTGVTGQLRYNVYDRAGTANDKTIISGDVNGDKSIDFQIELTGLKALTRQDFVL